MPSNSGRISRVKKQAIYEINVVKSCRENYQEKYDVIKKKIDEINAQLGVLLERGRLSANENEKRSIAREIKKLRENMQIMQSDADCFQDNVDMFDELVTLLDSFFMHERFKYIVKKIPEKRLPLMVKDPDKREEVNDLLLSLLTDFNTAWQKYLLSLKKRKEKRKHIQNVRDSFKERNETVDKEIESIMSEFDIQTEDVTETVVTPKYNRNDS